MEIPLQAQRPVLCRQSFGGPCRRNTPFNFRPFSGFLSYKPSRRSPQSFAWHIEHPCNGIFRPLSAAGDFSRKRTKRWSTPRSKGPAPKGFVPKAPAGTGSQKKDKRNDEEKRASVTPERSARAPESDVGPSTTSERDILEVSQAIKTEEQMKDSTNGKAGDPSPANQAVTATGQNLLKEIESVRGFIEEGQSSSGTVYDEAGLETDLEVRQGNSSASGSVVLGSETKSYETSTSNVNEADDLEVSRVNPISVASKNLLKEVESVRGFIEGGKSNTGNVFHETGLEAAVSELQLRNSIATGTEVSGSETRGFETATNNENKVNDLEVIATDNYGIETEVSDSDTRVSETVASDVKELGAVMAVQKSQSMVNYESTGSDNSGTKIALMVSELRGSDILPYESKPKDLVSVRENISLMNYQSIKSKRNVAAISVAPSDTSSDTMTSYEEEVEDLVQDNLVSLDENVTETGELESEVRVDIASDAKDLEKTSHKLELEKEAQESMRKLELEREAQKSSQKMELEREAQEAMRKSELEREAQEAMRKSELEREEAMRMHAVEELADTNSSKGNKIFIYPEIVRPDQYIEVFLNRSLSALKGEPNVMIMGAFNDWRWKSFTIKLEKTRLNGDWWSCRIHVPREAYILNFVFFNGKDVYENNDKKDFHISVEGAIDLFAFEDYLLEEKRREVEKLAKIQAERERQAEEQRRREEETAASEADRAQAKADLAQRREKLRALMKNALSSMENVWYFEPREFQDGDSVRLYYNKNSGPLAHAKEVWLHGGHNGWGYGLSVVSKLVQSEEVADWWYTEVTVPNDAIVLDWVFADGPPQKASLYDNNNRQDFHAIVPKNIPDEYFWVEEELRIYQTLQEERRLKEEAKRAKAEKTALVKAETKERTLKTFLLSQRDIVYTDPVDVQAGQDVTVYYNPSNTVLNGKSEVWLRCSFNRWTHRRGSLAPQKMLPGENTSHVKTTVKVPLDAYMMDFVFSEREDGGVFDNKYGMDYHVPVFGGVASEPPMHIVHIAVEMAPIAKVGGLGDVVTSLSRAIQELNHHVYVVLPKYECLNLTHVKDFHYQKSYSWGGTEIKVWFGKVEGLSVYFLEPLNGLFRTGSVYIGKNDGERFGFFCHAALEFLLQSGFHPDIIHCHDWSSAPVAWLYKEHYGQYGLTNARVVFTIHNLEFGAYFIGRAMAYADKATTVSNTYSKEVAGNPAIAPHLYKFHGILNGIDPDIWDPYNDNFIPVNYTSEDVIEGKQAAKEALQQRLSLKKGDLPLVGIITRLTHQKGIHLIKHAIWRTIERGGQVVLLGSAPDPRIQQEFVDLGNQLHNLHHDRARLVLTYDEPLSHLIYAGSDFILVPSIFEPCGLTQLVAMRYGSIPIVRKTGGLYDTVYDVDHDVERAKGQGLEPNGFSFEGADQAGVDYALNRAISSWYDAKEWLNSLRKRVMEQDWSWNRPALEYMELYHAARKY